MSKKLLVFVGVLAVSLVWAGAVSARTVSFWERLSALVSGSSPADTDSVTIDELKTKINSLRLQVEALRQEAETTVIPAQPDNLTKSVQTVPATQPPTSPQPPNTPNGNGDGGCRAGTTMPSGVAGQTLRCDGSHWVADGNLINTGGQVGVGINPMGLGGKLSVMVEKSLESAAIAGDHGAERGVGVSGTANNQGGFGVFGGANAGTGVYGVGSTGVSGRGLNGHGVYGEVAQNNFGSIFGYNTLPNGKAVWANQIGTGYGFYQSGASAKNYFEGNLGIGTAAPTAKLDVDGGSAGEGIIRAGASSQGNGVLKLMEDTGNKYGFSLRYDGTGDNFELFRHDNNATGVNVITIPRRTGNVGIGTASPSGLLHIAKTVGTPVVKIEGKSNATGEGAKLLWAEQDDFGVEAFYDSAENELRFRNIENGVVEDDQLLVIRRGGNVGIGTTEPTQKLEVAGALKLHSVGLPACNDATRGTLAFKAGSGTTDDHLYMCMRRNGAFSWVGS